jgi:hypothetical protein
MMVSVEPIKPRQRSDMETMGTSWVNFLGFLAALSVLASFCMTRIATLRSFSLLSNVLFILYGLLAHIYPVFLLHVVLLPVNLVKLYRIQSELWSLISARSGPFSKS